MYLRQNVALVSIDKNNTTYSFEISASGVAFPLVPSPGMMFYRTDTQTPFIYGQYGWEQITSKQLTIFEVSDDDVALSSEAILLVPATKPFTIPKNLSGSSVVNYGTSPECILVIRKNQVGVGSIILYSNQLSTFLFPSDVHFASGDVLSITLQRNNSSHNIKFNLLVIGSDGTVVSQHNPQQSQNGGTVTSIAVSGGATGLTTVGGPVTQSGTITIGGVLNVAHGGTGVESISELVDLILPPQTGNTGKYLMTTGSSLSWVTMNDISGITSVGSSTLQVDQHGGNTVDINLKTNGIAPGTYTNPASIIVDQYGRVSQITSGQPSTQLPATTGNAGKVLTTDGTNIVWDTIQQSNGGISNIYSNDFNIAANDSVPGGLVIDLIPTGITPGKYTLANVTVNENGIITGITGSTVESLFPNQVGNGGMYLTTDGTDMSWAPVQSANVGVTEINFTTNLSGIVIYPSSITSTGTVSLTGTLGIQSGGTGAATKEQALLNLAPPIIGNTGKVLKTDGSTIFWGVQNIGTVTSVGFESTDYDFNISGQPVTSSGVVNINLANTGVTAGSYNTPNITVDAKGRITNISASNIIPSQVGNSGKFLTTNGTTTSWATVTAGSGGTVTSVNVSSSDFSVTGAPITSSGTITLDLKASGVTAGTYTIPSVTVNSKGIVTAISSSTVDSILPAQNENSGKVLTTNGSTASWGMMNPGTITSITLSGANTGLKISSNVDPHTFTQSQTITNFGTFNLGGILTIENGGTNANDASTAINNLLPTQSGNSGKYLTTNGTNVSWSSVSAGGGTVTSVGLSTSLTGLTVSSSPITSSGTISISGTLGLESGGTGATTQAGAANAILPSQTSNSGKFLTTNGSNVSWSSVAFSGILPISQGGTGSADRNDALNALLPTQQSSTTPASSYTGNKFLMSNGANTSWSTPFRACMNVWSAVNQLDFSLSDCLVLRTPTNIVNGPTGVKSGQRYCVINATSSVITMTNPGAMVTLVNGTSTGTFTLQPGELFEFIYAFAYDASNPYSKFYQISSTNIVDYLPTTTNNAGKVLATDGTANGLSWVSLPAAPTALNMPGVISALNTGDSSGDVSGTILAVSRADTNYTGTTANWTAVNLNGSGGGANASTRTSAGEIKQQLQKAVGVGGLSAEWLRYHSANPIDMAVGEITYTVDGIPESFNVRWPDGSGGVYSLVSVSASYPDAVESYTVSYSGVFTDEVGNTVQSPNTGISAIITQPAITRGVNGRISTRPLRTVVITQPTILTI